MDSDDDVVLVEAEDLGDLYVEYFCDRLHLEIVVARTERAHFAALAFLCAFGNIRGLGARHAALFFDSFEVARVTPTVLNCPMSATYEHGIRLGGIERDRALAADAGRDLAIQRVAKGFLDGQDIGNLEPGPHRQQRK